MKQVRCWQTLTSVVPFRREQMLIFIHWWFLPSRVQSVCDCNCGCERADTADGWHWRGYRRHLARDGASEWVGSECVTATCHFLLPVVINLWNNNKTTTSWLSVSNKNWDVWRDVVPLDNLFWVLLPRSAFSLNKSPARTCNVLKSRCDWLTAAAAESRVISAAQMF